MHLLNAVELHEIIAVYHFQMDSVDILYSQIDLMHSGILQSYLSCPKCPFEPVEKKILH